MKRAALILALPLLAACGSSNPPAAAPPPIQQQYAEGEAAAAPSPSPEQFSIARELAAKLGCPDAEATQSGGAAVGAVELSCDVKPPPSASYTMWHYDVTVWPDEDGAASYVQTIRNAYNPKGVQAGRVVVLAQTPDSVPKAKATVSGSSL